VKWMLSPIRVLTLASACLIIVVAFVAGPGWHQVDPLTVIVWVAGLVTASGFLVWRLSRVLETGFRRRDGLTGVLSRREALAQISQGLSHSELTGGVLGVLSIDIERFGRVNAVYGQATGDAVLKEMARRITRFAPENALVARMGADEFLVVLAGDRKVDVAEPARRFCEGLRDCLHLPIELSGDEVPLRVRIGGEIVAPQDVSAQLTAEDLVMHANLARTSRGRKIEAGRDGFTLFMNEQVEEAARLVEMERELPAALRADEFFVVYQPIVDADTMRTVKCEALLRWSSHRLGSVPPQDFIAAAERAGHIDELGLFVLNAACAQAAKWLEAGEEIVVSVNVSATQLHSESFFAEVERTLRRHGVPAHLLALELTECVVVDADPLVRSNLERLAEAGISVALDDFGTGFSSLSYLSRLNIQTIKIDKSFVSAMFDGVREMRLIELICAIGKSMGYEIVAEGVESPAQARELVQFGVNRMQGYLFSPPVAAEKVQFDNFSLVFRRPREAQPLHCVVGA